MILMSTYHWCLSMMTASNANIFRVTGSLCGEFTGYRWIHKGPWHAALMFSLIYAWINDWVNNDEGGDLRRHRAHYGVIVMGCVNHKAYHKYGYERKYWKNSTQFWNIKQNLFIINGTETYVQHTYFNKLCYKTGCGRAQKHPRPIPI